MSANWISHKGKNILLIDYNGLDLQQQLDQIRTATKILLDTGKKDNLTISDVRNITISNEFTELAKTMGKQSGQVTKKAAALGVSGIRKVILQAVNAFSGNPRRPFDTLEEAKDWLVEE